MKSKLIFGLLIASLFVQLELKVLRLQADVKRLDAQAVVTLLHMEDVMESINFHNEQLERLYTKQKDNVELNENEIREPVFNAVFDELGRELKARGYSGEEERRGLVEKLLAGVELSIKICSFFVCL